MKILGIEHIGIAVDDLNKTSTFWGNILNILHTHTEVVESEQVKTTIFETGKGKIELLHYSLPRDLTTRKIPPHEPLVRRPINLCDVRVAIAAALGGEVVLRKGAYKGYRLLVLASAGGDFTRRLLVLSRV